MIEVSYNFWLLGIPKFTKHFHTQTYQRQNKDIGLVNQISKRERRKERNRDKQRERKKDKE